MGGRWGCHPTLPVYRSGSVPGVASLHDSRDALADQEKNLKLGLTEYGWPFQYRRDGALADSRGQKIVDGSSYLRLRRRGAEILGAFGPDGVHWTSFPPLSANLKDRLKVGVSAINTATKPLTAELEGFEVSERPGDRGDVNPGTVNL